MPKRRGRETAAKPVSDRRQRSPQIRLTRKPSWDVSTRDQVIDFFQELFDTRVEVVQIGDYWHTCAPSPLRGLNRCGCIVSIDVQGASLGNPFALEFLRLQGKTMVPLPKNGALAAVIHQDHRLLASAATGHDQMSLNRQPFIFRTVNHGRAIVADFADVAGFKPPLPACGNCRCDLTTGQNVGRTKFHLGSQHRVVWDQNQHVGSIESNTDQINLWDWRQGFLPHGKRIAATGCGRFDEKLGWYGILKFEPSKPLALRTFTSI